MDINKKEDPENLLFNVKKISDNITDITTKINNLRVMNLVIQKVVES